MSRAENFFAKKKRTRRGQDLSVESLETLGALLAVLAWRAIWSRVANLTNWTLLARAAWQDSENYSNFF